MIRPLQITNTDQSAGPTRTISVSGSVLRSGFGCSLQRAILADYTIAQSPAAINVFNVWSDASHITLKGDAEVLPNNDIFNTSYSSNGRATFNIDVDCAVPQNPPIKYVSEVRSARER